MAVFHIQKLPDGKLAPFSRDIFAEHVRSLPPGRFVVAIEPEKAGKFTPTRYKYYFDCVLGLAFPKVHKRFLLVDRHGETRHPASVNELHEIIKIVKNPVTVMDADGGIIRVIGGTTRVMSDREFIGEFIEEIIADFSGPPYYAYPDTGCPTWDEWKEMHKAGAWAGFKKQM